MNLYTFIANQLPPLQIPLHIKENILLCIKSYEFSEAKNIINYYINKTSDQNLLTNLVLIINEIDKHIELFNDDFESDEIIEND